jgi:membrane-bound metal-dependent hydrolase YbcI (DUF457 family)
MLLVSRQQVETHSCLSVHGSLSYELSNMIPQLGCSLISCQRPAALAGNYVNFGVFELYGDRALADALDIGLKMALSVPLLDILAFRKVSPQMSFEKRWLARSFPSPSLPSCPSLHFCRVVSQRAITKAS